MSYLNINLILKSNRNTIFIDSETYFLHVKICEMENRKEKKYKR